MKIKIWWVSNICWLIVFAIGVVYIMQRKLDGAGIPQTPPLKWASLAVLGSVFILIALCQALVLYFVKRSNKISHN